MTERRDDMPPDQDQRDMIRERLDSTILVEAAAGTGKTTSMMGRMVALIANGRCAVDKMAAVTFTRKAAAELRVKFQSALTTNFQSQGVHKVVDKPVSLVKSLVDVPKKEKTIFDGL